MNVNRNKTALFIAGIIVLSLAILIIGSFIPTLRLENTGMRQIQGQWVKVYYEGQEAAAKDVFEAAEERAQTLSRKLGLIKNQTINIYIYDTQFTFQTKKYGFIGTLLGLDWYIGDNRGANVLLTSPANPGKVHGYEECRDAGLHEMVHAYNFLINPKMPLWLNEGAALYLTNGDPPENLYDASNVPTLEDMQTANPIKFNDMGGYYFAYTYVEYLDKTYGWERVLSLLQTGDTGKAFSTSAQSLYNGWLDFLKSHYSNKS